MWQNYTIVQNSVSHTSSYSLSVILVIAAFTYLSSLAAIPHTQVFPIFNLSSYISISLSHSFCILLLIFQLLFLYPRSHFHPLCFSLSPCLSSSLSIFRAHSVCLLFTSYCIHTHNRITRSYIIHDKNAFVTETYIRTYTRKLYIYVRPVTHTYAFSHPSVHSRAHILNVHTKRTQTHSPPTPIHLRTYIHTRTHRGATKYAYIIYSSHSRRLDTVPYNLYNVAP